jgi:hypothetical protein
MRRLSLALAGALALGLPTAGTSQVRLTQEEALRLAFPEPAAIERRTAFLDESALSRARELAGPEVEVNQRVITYYVGTNGESALGVAYFDAHLVRTLPEVLMIVVTPDARIERIEILRFADPPDYLVPASWLGQFYGRELSDGLAVKRAIVNMTGATLTSRAVTSAARRVLALHAVIGPLIATSEEGVH